MSWQMKLDSASYSAVASGNKTVEIRLNDCKRQRLHVGDLIGFTNLADNSQHVVTKITALTKFANFEQLYQQVSATSMGYQPDEPAKPADMLQIYSKTAVQQYGVLAIGIKLVSSATNQ